jgi:hypothetical protein
MFEQLIGLTVALLFGVGITVFGFVFFSSARLRKRIYERWLPIKEPFYARATALSVGIFGVFYVIFVALAMLEIVMNEAH